jgi:general secretion pathway protein D
MQCLSKYLRCRAGLLLVVSALGGCAAQRLHSDGQRQLDHGKVGAGLANLREAMLLDPGNLRYRLDYINRRDEETNKLIQRGQELRAAGNTSGARDAFLAALQLDDSNEPARRGVSDVDMDIHHRDILAEAQQMAASGSAESARERVMAVLIDNPKDPHALLLMRKLDTEIDAKRRAKEALTAAQSVLKKPVTLQFRDANLRMVFEALSRTTGLNVIFDRDVRPDLKTTIFVHDSSVEDTVNLILLQNQLEKKVLNVNTVFIYPATPAKQKEYQELKVRTFHISNGDAKYILSVLKSVLKIKDGLVDERSNTLVLRDTPEALEVAAKVIAAHDLADAEVMLEVQVLEISRDRLTDLGIKWPDGATISTPAPTGGTLTLGALGNLTHNQLPVTPLSLSLNLKLQDTDANLLASPRIRVRDHEKAKILIGDKVPVITNTVTPVQTGSAVVTGSIQYIDVGIKLEAEPYVYSEGDVGIKLNLEVSNIVKEIAGPSGSLAYQIGTRSVSTSLRLRDGETQVLGGLISDSDRQTASKVPGIGQMPVLGRLFSDHNGDHSKTEILLSITPRIVRAQGIAEDAMRDVWSGTETTIHSTQLRLDPISGLSAPSARPRSRTGAANPTPLVPPDGAYQSTPALVPPTLGAPASTAASASTLTPPLIEKVAPAEKLPVAVTPSAPPAVAIPPALIGVAPANSESVVPAPALPVPTESTADPSDRKMSPTAIPPLTSIDGTGLTSSTAHSTGSGAQITWGMLDNVKAGDQFKVSLNASGFDAIPSLPLYVRYDPRVLSFVAASPGAASTRVGVSTIDPVINDAAGRVNMTLNADAGKYFAGSGELVNLTFSAKMSSKQTQVQMQLAQSVNNDRSALRTISRPQPLMVRIEP